MDDGRLWNMILNTNPYKLMDGTRRCPECKKTFKSKVKHKKFCSIPCTKKYHNRKKYGINRCEYCEKEHKNEKYCSKECKDLDSIG